MDSRWGKRFKIRVINAYLERKDANYSKNFKNRSLHLEGRAFDLELIEVPPRRLKKRTLYKRSMNHRKISRTLSKNKRRIIDMNLPTLAGLAFYRAKFSFVEVKAHHIHVSCAKTGKRVYISLSCISLYFIRF